MKYLIKFQLANDLTPDGILGPITFRFMTNHFAIEPHHLAYFLAQVSHETAGFIYGIENLNYSANGLMTVFSKYFTPNSAKVYARNPEKIANLVYANRMGNGDVNSGDGWRFRGRGALQLTGRNNYTAFSAFIKDDCVSAPNKIIELYYFHSAVWFFRSNNLFKLCHPDFNISAITALTRRINGGTNGLKDRITKTYKYAKLV